MKEFFGGGGNPPERGVAPAPVEPQAADAQDREVQGAEQRAQDFSGETGVREQNKKKGYSVKVPRK
jgi:hypothetical protein